MSIESIRMGSPPAPWPRSFAHHWLDQLRPPPSGSSNLMLRGLRGLLVGRSFTGFASGPNFTRSISTSAADDRAASRGRGPSLKVPFVRVRLGFRYRAPTGRPCVRGEPVYLVRVPARSVLEPIFAVPQQRSCRVHPFRSPAEEGLPALWLTFANTLYCMSTESAARRWRDSGSGLGPRGRLRISWRSTPPMRSSSLTPSAPSSPLANTSNQLLPKRLG